MEATSITSSGLGGDGELSVFANLWVFRSVASFLPRNIYPPRPTRVFSDDPPRAPSVMPEGVEGGEMEVDEGDEGEVEVTEVKVSVGLVGNGQDQQELVLQRFESRRIGKQSLCCCCTCRDWGT